MADEIIIDVQVNTEEVQKKLSAAIVEVQKLRKEQKELTDTIKAGNDENGEQAKRLAEVEANLKKQQAAVKSNTAALQVANKEINTQNMTLDEQRQLLGQLQKAYGGLTPEQQKSTKTGKLLSDQINTLNDSVKAQEAAIGDHRRNVGNYTESVVQAFDQAGVGVSGFMGKLKAFFANPWAVLVGAIVTAFKALIDAFKGSEDRMRELQTAFAPFEGVINTGKQALDAFAKVISGVVVEALSGLSKAVQWVIEKVDAVGKAFGKDWGLSEKVAANAQATKEIAAQEQELIDKKRAWVVEEAQINSQISDLRARAAEKDKYTTDQRIAFMEQARDLELKAANTRKQIAQDELNLAELQAAQSENDAAANDALAAAKAKVIEQTTNYNNKVRELNGTLSELRKTTEEYKATLSAGDLVLTDEEVSAIVASYMNAGAQVAATMEELQKEYGVDLLKRDDEEEDVPSHESVAAQLGFTEAGLEYYRELLTQGMDATEAYKQAKIASEEEIAAVEAEKAKERQRLFNQTTTQMAGMFGAMSDMLAQYGEENKAAAAASKAFALMQLTLTTGQSVANGALAISAGIAQAQSVPFPANIAAVISVIAQLGGIIATVGSSMAQAKQIIQGADAGRFAGGGVVGGTSYEGDKLTAHVNSGELILNREQQGQLLFNMANAQAAVSQIDYERMQAAFLAAVRELPAPVLVYSEFEDFTASVESNKLIYTVKQ